MIRLLIIVVVVVLVFTGIRRMTDYWGDVKSKQNDGHSAQQQLVAPVPTQELPGLPAQFESSLQSAQNMGTVGMKRWLDSYRKYVTDPRLAAIELDYVQLVGRESPGEARQLFTEIRQRLPANSPLQPRIKQMERIYQ